jgi:hypothetical protein
MREAERRTPESGNAEESLDTHTARSANVQAVERAVKFAKSTYIAAIS